MIEKFLETERLTLREIVESDGEFILDLPNQPTFIKYIGNRHIKNFAVTREVREVIENRYRQSYRDIHKNFTANLTSFIFRIVI